MKQSLTPTYTLKLCATVMLLAVLQACGGGSKEDATIASGTDTSDPPKSASPTQNPPQSPFPTNAAGFPVSENDLDLDPYFGTWAPANNACHRGKAEDGFDNFYRRGEALFISPEVANRSVELFHDANCTQKAGRFTFRVEWTIEAIDMPGFPNAIRILEKSRGLSMGGDGGTGFSLNRFPNLNFTNQILATVHEGKLYFTYSGERDPLGYPVTIRPQDSYTKAE